MPRIRLLVLGVIGALVALSAVPATGGAIGGTCGGLLEPACPPPQPTEPPGPTATTISLTPANAERTGPRPKVVRLRGQVLGANGTAQGLVVTQRAPAYAGSEQSTPLQTAPDGTFTLSVKPSVGMAVKVALAPGQTLTGESPEMTIAVRPAESLTFGKVRRGRASFAFTARAPRAVPGGAKVRPGTARTVYVYAVASTGTTARRVGTAKLRSVRCASDCRRQAGGSIAVTKQVRRSVGFIVCARTPVLLGIAYEHELSTCGHRTVRPSDFGDAEPAR